MSNFQVTKKDLTTTLCSGAVSTAFETYTAATSCGISDSYMFRPSPVASGWGGRRGMRIFTQYTTSGFRITRYQPGLSSYFDEADVCNYPLQVHITDQKSAVWITGLGLGPYGPYQEFTDDQKSGLLTQAYAQALEPIFDIQTELGELGKALLMLRSIKERMINIVGGLLRAAIRKHGFNRVALTVISGRDQELSLMLSGLWLEARYGIRPLLSSMESLGELCANMTVGPEDVVYNTGKAKIVVPVSRTMNPDQQYFYSQGYLQGLTTSIVPTYSLRACVTAQVTPFRHRLDGSALYTLWELTPLSFVFDWLFSIGSYLRVLTRSNMPLAVQACTSLELKTEFSVIGNTHLDNEYYRMESPLIVQGSEYEYTRTPTHDLTPTLYYKGDSLPDDPLKFLDLLGLARQILFK